MDRSRLEQIEEYVLRFFREQQQTRILAKELFDSTSTYANADLVRALEDLEKKRRFLVRHTSDGNDYISLTPLGISQPGLENANVVQEAPALPHPPKSATKLV